MASGWPSQRTRKVFDPLDAEAPVALQFVVVGLAIGEAPVAQGEAGAFAGIGAAMDAVAQVVAIGQAAAVGEPRLGPVEGQLDGIEQGGLAAAVHAAEEDNGASGRGAKVGLLPAAVDAEVLDGDAVEDHGAACPRVFYCVN